MTGLYLQKTMEGVSSWLLRIIGFQAAQTEKSTATLKTATPGPMEGLPLTIYFPQPPCTAAVVQLIHPTVVARRENSPDTFLTQIAVQHGFRGRFTGWAVGRNQLQEYLKSINLVNEIGPHPSMLGISNEGYEAEEQYLFTEKYAFTLEDVYSKSRGVFLNILDTPAIWDKVLYAVDAVHEKRTSIGALELKDIVIIGIKGNWRSAISSARKFISWDDLEGYAFWNPVGYDYLRIAELIKKCSGKEYDVCAPINRQHKRAMQRELLSHLADNIKMFVLRSPSEEIRSEHIRTHIVFRGDCEIGAFVRDTINYIRSVGVVTVAEWAKGSIELVGQGKEYEGWFEEIEKELQKNVLLGICGTFEYTQRAALKKKIREFKPTLFWTRTDVGNISQQLLKKLPCDGFIGYVVNSRNRLEHYPGDGLLALCIAGSNTNEQVQFWLGRKPKTILLLYTIMTEFTHDKQTFTRHPQFINYYSGDPEAGFLYDIFSSVGCGA